jgi:hypothetical protein
MRQIVRQNSVFNFAADWRSEFEARQDRAMTKLLLASELTDARTFSHDDRLRSGTPGPEAVRLKTPALSHSWTLISFVVVHRSADGCRDHHRVSGIKRRYDERDHRSKAQGCRGAQGTGAGACTQNARHLSSAQLPFRPLSCERCVAGRNANRHAGGISRFQDVRELVRAVSRGEAPPPTRYSGERAIDRGQFQSTTTQKLSPLV